MTTFKPGNIIVLFTGAEGAMFVSRDKACSSDVVKRSFLILSDPEPTWPSAYDEFFAVYKTDKGKLIVLHRDVGHVRVV